MITGNHSKEIEAIVSTLLYVADRVVEVSADHVVTKTWDNADFPVSGSDDYIGRKISDIRNDAIIKQCDALVEEGFKTGKSSYLEYTTTRYNATHTFSIRILTAHPCKDFLFITVENLSKKQRGEVVEDKWKLALDAAGDGMWDINMITDKIFFSDKWHDIFGYEATEVTTGAAWGAKIHPDDLLKAQEQSTAYLSGKALSYMAEMRYLCKDGGYKWILSRGVVVAWDADGSPLRFIGTHTDINERKIAEEKYSSVAQLLSKLINNLNNAILVTDEDRKVVFVNDMFCEMFSVEGGPASLMGLDMYKSIAVRRHFYKESDHFINRVNRILSQREIVLNDELELVDGRILSRDYLPLTLGSDNKGAIWKFKDITSQKNTERRFEKQRLFYENILNCIPADVAVFDAQYRYLFVNRNAFKNDGLRKWMIGKTDVDYARYSKRPDSFYKTRFALYDKVMEERVKYEMIEKLIARDGTEEYHLRILHPVYYENGELEFLMGYGLNITDLIKTQEALRISAETFTSAFNYSGVGMALISPDGKWLDVNNLICQQTGYSKEELLTLAHQDITYIEDLEIDRPLINEMLRKEISTYTIEKRFLSKENKIVLVLLTVSLVWNTDGTPKFFIAQVIDITKKKALENEITRKNAELEATKTSLINKINQLEEFSHIIAHNLRGPAGNIKLISQSFARNDNDGTENALKGAFTPQQALELIAESSQSLVNSLNTLMEITEIKLNKEIPYNNCDVESVIHEIASLMHSTIYEKQASIKQELELKEIRYPKAYLENILYNLLSNALKYSRPGTQPEIIISTRMKDGRVQISVKDNGLGIDMVKYGKSVFKLNQVFHSGYDSKGVGLYITKTQIESLGGSIGVKSEVNEGSEFIVTL